MNKFMLYLTAGLLAVPLQIFAARAPYAVPFTPNPEQSVFGLNRGTDNPGAAQAGVKFTRFDLYYPRPEHSPKDQKKFLDNSEKAIRNALANGQKILLVLHPPRYMYSHGNMLSHTRDKDFPADATMEHWGNYIAETVGKYKGLVKYYEICNEPDISAISPQLYAAMLFTAYNRGRAADPEAYFGGFSTAGVNRQFIREALAAGCGNCFDFVTVHPYQWSRSFNSRQMLNDLSGLEKLLSQAGCDRPVWLTEFGYATQPVGGLSRELQADLLAKFYLTLAALEKYKGFWYVSHDWPGKPNDHEANFGIMNGLSLPKLSYYAYYFASRLDGARPGTHPQIPGVESYRYTLPSGWQAIAFWCSDGENERKIKLFLDGIAGNMAELKSLPFTSQTLTLPGKTKTVEVTARQSPQLILFPGRDPKITKFPSPPRFVERPKEVPQRFLAIDSPPVTSPGEILCIPFTAINYGSSTWKLSPQITLPEGWKMTLPPSFECPVDKTIPGTFEIKIPGDQKNGKYEISFKEEGMAPVVLPVTVDLPVHFRIEPASDLNTPLTLTATSTSTHPVELKLSLNRKELAPFSLAPGQSQIIRTGIVAAGIAHLEGTLNGQKFKLEKPINSIYIPHTATPVKIDGDRKKWLQIPPFRLDSREHVAILPAWWTGPEDLSADIRLQYDDEYLYFSALVQDDVFFQNSLDGSTWLGDGLQLCFAIDGKYAYELLLAKTSKGIELFTLASLDGKNGHTRGALKAFSVIKNYQRKYFYEVAIPWSSLAGVKHASGENIAFNFIVNDNDGAGRKGYLQCVPIPRGRFKTVEKFYQWHLE